MSDLPAELTDAINAAYVLWTLNDPTTAIIDMKQAILRVAIATAKAVECANLRGGECPDRGWVGRRSAYCSRCQLVAALMVMA